MEHVSQTQQLRDSVSIPARAGIGLRSQHHQDVLNCQAKVGWLEVHSENYFGKGGAPLRDLENTRANYPLSLHGVGMSLGSVDALDFGHLHKLKALIARIEPGLVSEHLSWSSYAGKYLNDLVPLPYTDETLNYLVERINAVQDFLGRQLLIENPSSYLEYQYSTYTESRFLDELARRSGCGVLLDINNVYVSCSNHGWNALDYIQDIAAERVGEMHLAGHTVNSICGRNILIDTHNGPVCEHVWQLYRQSLQVFGKVPTLIEWDADLPVWEVLVAEAGKADAYLESCYAQTA
jgi:uncharacterized protein (UPF0276 family)